MEKNTSYSSPNNASSNEETAIKSKQSAFTTMSLPQISLPKGGGAIKSIDEKFTVNAANGTAGSSIGFPFSPSRNGFMPNLSLSYNSGNGNSEFGLGWSAEPPAIVRSTRKRLPQYRDTEESDTFTFAGGEDLVPALIKDASGNWIKDSTQSGGLTIARYRPRIESGFTKIEKITEAGGDVYWRATSGGNVLSIFGKSKTAKVFDPADPSRIFRWLLEFSCDDKGNCYQYEYKKDDKTNVPNLVHEKNRLNGLAPCTNTYLKRVKYCNKIHFNRSSIDLVNWDSFLANLDYLLELVLDYGEHDPANPQPGDDQGWTCRRDAFSDYRAGFETRTYRLCSRVLMFHRFAELGASPCLVKSLILTYNQTDTFTFLTSVSQKGYIRKADGTYTEKALPPIDFTYEQLGWDTTIKTLPKESLENLPGGIDNTAYQWIDLYSEGISGILSEQAGSWFYKSNSGNGNFDAVRVVASKPSLNGISTGQLHFQDLEANGKQALVSRDLNGYYELADNDEWLPFNNFTDVPNIDLRDPNVKLLDLNGDGRADILLSEESVFVWYASKGKAGYESYQTRPKSFDEEKGPGIIFNDSTQSIVLADMTGDGLMDIVRIRNRDVVYWPNLGYGRFGAKVTMNNAPVFDTPESFNPHLIKLADLDGSGNTGIVYLGHDSFKIYFNQAGNGWSDQNILSGVNPLPFPKTDEYSTVSVVDLLGNGTACIVWSSPLPQYKESPLHYIDLMAGKKPHVMIASKNNMGAETHISYKPSTFFYLQDKKAGAPWVTRLPFPVQCVSATESIDNIAGTRFTSQYSYHHGYYDHAEREFRGFGRVDQTDTEDFEQFKKHVDLQGIQLVQEDFHQPPVLTKTWFHTGAFLDKEKILDQFAHEYYQNNAVPEKQPQDPPLPAGLTNDEWREALRACKGITLRTEVYTPDGSDKQDIPYTTANTSCLIQLVQPRLQNSYSVWMVQQSEALSYTYERNPADPRIAHNITLETDSYGNVLKAAAISYGRKIADINLNPAEQAEQAKTHVMFSQTNVTNKIDSPAAYRLPVSYEAITWELTGLAPASGTYFGITEMKAAADSAAAIPYEALPAPGKQEKRLIEQSRTLFLTDDMTGALALGIIESLALPYQSYKLALTPGLRDNIFGDKVNDALLLGEGKYVNFNDSNYWIATGTQTIDAAHFYQATVITDPFGFTTQVNYDSGYRFFVQQTTDAIGNTSSVTGFNYRTLTPYLVQDINDNRTGARMDELGMVLASFVMGKQGENKGDLMDTTATESSAADQPGATLEYNLFNYINTGKPNFTRGIINETHYFDLQNGVPSLTQVSYAYASGSGAILMQKKQAEPGVALQENGDGTVTQVDTTPNLRWVGNGRTILNNKGKPVKQFEPYFSASFEFEDNKELVERGVTPVITYDSAGRAIKTDLPDGTLTRLEFDAWTQRSFDQNDTVLESQWYADRITVAVPGTATPEEIAAANKAAVHANTPTVSYLDSLGRTFVSIADNGPTGKYKTTTENDIEGNTRKVTDARGNVVIQYKYDMLGAQLYSLSMDAGERWSIMDVMGRPLRGFDSRGNVFRYEFDKLHRPVKTFIKPGTAAEINIEKVIYGEGATNDKANNLRGQVYRHFDGSGITTTGMFDFKSNPLQTSRQLCTEYKNDVDWNTSPAVDTGVFMSLSVFDALNRPLSITSPDQSIYLPSYNQAGMLNSVDVKLRGAAGKTGFVKDINYDVKGRRESIVYGNNTKTNYLYDAKTFKVTQILTTGKNGTDLLQKLSYTYDPVGNITSIKDEAQQTVYFNNSVVNPSSQFVYDAIYQLISATGREHIGQNLPPSYSDASRINQPLPGDGAALRNYTQSYQYDPVGNILQMIHAAGAGSWTRIYEYDNTSNRLNNNKVNTITETFTYDAHGNIQNLQQLQGIAWNAKDQMQHANLGGGGIAYYVYDGAGQRVRKVIERLDGTKEHRIYLGGFELYRKLNSAGTITEETATLHVSDDTGRIALVETKTIKGSKPATDQLIRYQYSNQLGSAALELDENAAIISYEEYHPYGSTAYQAINASITAAAKRYRYTNMERDDETGLEYHSARYYLPWLGRWLSADPIGPRGGLNMYAYCNDNPTCFSDVAGKSPEKPPIPSGVRRFFGKVGRAVAFVLSLHKDASNGTIEIGDSPFSKTAEDVERHAELEVEGEMRSGGGRNVGNAPPPPPPPEPPDKRLVTARDLHENRNLGNAKPVEKITPEPKPGGGSGPHPGGSGEPHIGSGGGPHPGGGGGPHVNGGGAIGSEVEAGTEIAKNGARIGGLIEGFLPNPLDALILLFNYYGSYAEAKDRIKETRTRAGFATGLAAGILGLTSEEVNDKLFYHDSVSDVATHILSAEGLAEVSFNQGLSRGFAYSKKLTAAQRNALTKESFTALATAGFRTNDLFSANTVYTVAATLVPVVNDVFARNAQKLENERLKQQAKEVQRRFDAGMTKPY